MRDFVKSMGRLFSAAGATGLLAMGACGDDAASPADVGVEDAAADATTDADPDVTAETVEDTADDTGPDVSPPPEPDAIFAAGMDPAQRIFDGPFPNDALRDEGGQLALAPLSEDPRFSGLAAELQLTRFDALLRARAGFSFTSAVMFPMGAAPDLATFDGKVEFIALAGPDAGTRFPAQVDWFEPGRVMMALPAFGHAMVPGSTYGVVIAAGVKDVDGRDILAPESISGALASEAPSDPSPAAARARANASWGLLREATSDPAGVVMATVFTTDTALPWLRAFFDAADAFALAPPRAEVGRTGAELSPSVLGPDLFGDDLATYLGTPEAPFAFMPTAWNADARVDAGGLPGASGPYAGGTFGGGVGRIVHGGLVMPSFNQKLDGDRVAAAAPEWDDGLPVPHGRSLVPFSVFLCTSHLSDPETGAVRDDLEIPVAIFTHGGTETRTQALPFAVNNCLQGIATAVLDLPFHGGRQVSAYASADDLIVPVPTDAFNAYNGSATADGVGDPGGATVSVGSLFGLPSRFDPDVIEANLVTIAVETRVLLRYLREPGENGLGAFVGATFDADRVMMQSLSFGTNFTVGVWAADPSVSHIVTSVGSGYVLSVNLPMAPANAGLVTTIVDGTLGLAGDAAYLANGAWRDPAMALLQWFSQRADPLAYAPFVLRYRDDGHAPNVLATGNSWDETLFGPAQTSFNNALGLPVLADADVGWALDTAMAGADTVAAAPFAEAPVSANATFGDRTATAALFYLTRSCHPHITAPVCVTRYEPDYPPATPREAPEHFTSPICEIHAMTRDFAASFAAGEGPAAIPMPAGTICEGVYGVR